MESSFRNACAVRTIAGDSSGKLLHAEDFHIAFDGVYGCADDTQNGVGR
jgi:hypothetical protein